jgi:hypothetical protein
MNMNASRTLPVSELQGGYEVPVVDHDNQIAIRPVTVGPGGQPLADIADGRCASVSSDEHRRFLEAFVGAAQKGDLVTLESFFAEDVASYSGSGIRSHFW